MKRNRLHTVTIIVGSLLALAITFSQFVPSNCPAEKVKTEQNDQKSADGTATYISLPTFSLPAPFQAQSDPEAYCLFEIIFEEESPSTDIEPDLHLLDRFFETIFTVIISPNAP